MSSEFALIDALLAQTEVERADIEVGNGDDGATLTVPDQHAIVVAVDTMVAGRHFFHDTPPADLGYKSLAVVLSDIAAMGARPAWATLSLTLPEGDEGWIGDFGRGWHELAQPQQVALVGGDLTQGPLTITVQVTGLVRCGCSLRRVGASIGEDVWVTGTLGDAALAVRLLTDDQPASAALIEAMRRPRPPLGFGAALFPLATAAIDVSDGLTADLEHLCTASGCGARIVADDVPRSAAVRGAGDVGLDCALRGGDDYQICFTAAPDAGPAITELARQHHVQCTRIGAIEPGARVCVVDAAGVEMTPVMTGFQHFREHS